MRSRKKEGKPLPDTPEMKMWREEYKNMSLEEHQQKLKMLGLDEEDLKEMNEALKEEKKESKEKEK